MKPKITDRQSTAYILTETEGGSRAKAARTMRISEAAICKLLQRLEKNYPELFITAPKSKMVSYDPLMDGQIREKF